MHILILTLMLGTSAAHACGAVPIPLLNATHQAEQAHGLPRDLLVSLIWAESRYCVNAVSQVGAQGLGQLMPATARSVGVADPFNPTQNLSGSAAYLRQMWDTFRNWDQALLAYHDGPTNVRNGYVSTRALNHRAFILGTYQAIRKQGGLQVIR